MPNPVTEALHLKLADQHIALAREHVSRQQAMVEWLEEQGHDASLAHRLLHAMRETLRELEVHRELIVRFSQDCDGADSAPSP